MIDLKEMKAVVAADDDGWSYMWLRANGPKLIAELKAARKLRDALDDGVYAPCVVCRRSAGHYLSTCALIAYDDASGYGEEEAVKP